MLNNLFISVLNMSLIGSYAIIFVLLARALLKKTPKIFSYSLWCIVLFRLLCPVSFESVLSLMPITKAPIPQDIIYSTSPQINTGIAALDSVVNPMLPVAGKAGESVNPIQIWLFIGAVIWTLGVVAMVIYSVVAFVKLKRSLIGAAPFKANIYLADHISSPFVIGIFKPKIYLPPSLSNSEKDFIISHEMCHIRRLDHATRILGFAALTIHWFNPLVWLAFIASGKDMEMSCDEAVMKKMGADIRAEYSQSLLRFGISKKVIHATPLAFGEGDTKKRVKNVLNYKKPATWIIAITAIVCFILAVCFTTNPKNSTIINPYVQKSPINTKLTHDQAVASALFSLANKFPMGECIAEGHIILGYDESNKNETQIYALTAMSKYGFENGNFVEVSGSAFPAVITLFSDNRVEIEEPIDGGDYASSIEKMFPKEYHDKFFKNDDIGRDSIKQQKEKYASEYLVKIGREAKIGDYSDFDYISLTDAGVSAEASNNLQAFYKEYNFYPSFIGTSERLENGVRMTYEMSYFKNQNKISFTKYDYDTKKVLEKFTADAKTGSILD